MGSNPADMGFAPGASPTNALVSLLLLGGPQDVCSSTQGPKTADGVRTGTAAVHKARIRLLWPDRLQNCTAGASAHRYLTSRHCACRRLSRHLACFCSRACLQLVCSTAGGSQPYMFAVRLQSLGSARCSCNVSVQKAAPCPTFVACLATASRQRPCWRGPGLKPHTAHAAGVAAEASMFAACPRFWASKSTWCLQEI